MRNSDRVIWEWVVETMPEAIGVVEWSFYGGDYSTGESVSVSTSDINWDKIKPLRSTSEKMFTDTFHDPDYIDVLEGKLILNDGSEFDVGLRIDSQEMLNTIVDYMVSKNKE